jgi:D-alanyl-lipoteichoic acid acyltransferase DltB (MBOAT superfamily)
VLFNSFEFLLFFPVVLALYFLLPAWSAQAFLLAASYFFYACWEPSYLILIWISTLVDFIVGKRLGKAEGKWARRSLLLTSLTANLGILFIFKYFNFFNGALYGLADLMGWEYSVPYLDVLLPVGVSFYTFQTLAYTIDVYRRRRGPENNLLHFSLYVAFFPQLVAGPIERSERLLPQLAQRAPLNVERWKTGLFLMLWGFFKKTVLADNLAVYVDQVYANPAGHAGMPIWVGTFFFAMQIYCDFSGYSDIAIGSARMLGIDLMTNFRSPYHAESISDFWRRWHISLSTWFRDYLYIPLGGSRKGVPRTVVNVLIVFVISGLWHGANWTFLIWGAIHGVAMAATILLRGASARINLEANRVRLGWLWSFACWLVTFAFVYFAWIFFRAQSLGAAIQLVQGLFGSSGHGVLLEGVFGRRELVIVLTGLTVMEAGHQIERRMPLDRWIRERRAWFRWLIYLGLTLFIFNCGATEEVPFFYFQF